MGEGVNDRSECAGRIFEDGFCMSGANDAGTYDGYFELGGGHVMNLREFGKVKINSSFIIPNERETRPLIVVIFKVPYKTGTQIRINGSRTHGPRTYRFTPQPSSLGLPRQIGEGMEKRKPCI